MSKLQHKSPLLGALLQAGREALEEDVKERLDELKDTPMGHMLKAAMRRKAELEAQGKQVSEEDVKAWLDECKAIHKAQP